MGSNPIFSAIFIFIVKIKMIFRGIAQLVEQWSPKPRAQGSSPCAPAIQENLENVEIQRIQGFFICLMIYSICKNIGQMYPFLPFMFGQLRKNLRL